MKKIYLDNGATSYPKPQEVMAATMRYFEEMTGNAGRSTESARGVDQLIFDLRANLADFFGFAYPENVIFTKNITEAINTICFGYLEEGDHVLISNFEHNAVVRPLHALASLGRIEYDLLPFRADGTIELVEIEKRVRPETKLVICVHASNVTGQILDVETVIGVCKKHQIKFMLDAAQTAGFLDLDMSLMGIDCLAFTGHKSLLGPTGTGGVLISQDMAKRIRPLIYGGTGSLSESIEQPAFPPDHFESGTLNLMGLMGLEASLKWLRQRGLSNIREHEWALMDYLEGEIEMIQGVSGLRHVPFKDRTGVLSLTFDTAEPSIVAHRLNREFGVVTRVGLHCAPLAHQTLGTYPSGTLRISLSDFSKEEDLNRLIEGLKTIL